MGEITTIQTAEGWEARCYTNIGLLTCSGWTEASAIGKLRGWVEMQNAQQ